MWCGKRQKWAERRAFSGVCSSGGEAKREQGVSGLNEECKTWAAHQKRRFTLRRRRKREASFSIPCQIDFPLRTIRTAMYGRRGSLMLNVPSYRPGNSSIVMFQVSMTDTFQVMPGFRRNSRNAGRLNPK